MDNKLLVCVFLVTSLVASVAQAAGGDFDLGIIIGEPTGLSAKKWLDATHAIDVAVGWKTGTVDEATVQADYLIHDFTIIRGGNWPTVFYYGIGARVHDRNNRRQRDGIRLPVGVEIEAVVPSLQLFAELVPRLDVSPETDFHIDGALGFRYRFAAAGRK